MRVFCIRQPNGRGGNGIYAKSTWSTASQLPSRGLPRIHNKPLRSSVPPNSAEGCVPIWDLHICAVTPIAQGDQIRFYNRGGNRLPCGTIRESLSRQSIV